MMPRVCLQFVIVFFSDRTHLLFLVYRAYKIYCICANSCNVNVRPWADPEGGRGPSVPLQKSQVGLGFLEILVRTSPP